MTATELVSRASGVAGVVGDFGSSDPRISGDGRYVAFVSGARNLDGPAESDFGNDLYLRDLVTKTTARLSKSPSGDPSLYLGTYGYMDHAVSASRMKFAVLTFRPVCVLQCRGWRSLP